MSFLIFVAALLAIVLLAMAVNRATGTKTQLLQALQLEPGETELWRDSKADFATRPRQGGAAVQSFARMRRHTVIWTDRRILVAQRLLFSKAHLITHQIVWVHDADSAETEAAKAARSTAGGFYGRGFVTIAASTHSFGQVNHKDCITIKPTEQSGSLLNVDEALVFTDRMAELQRSLAFTDGSSTDGSSTTRADPA